MGRGGKKTRDAGETTATEVVAALVQAGVRPGTIAAATAVSHDVVAEWAAGAAATRLQRDRLVGLLEVVDLLRTTMSGPGADTWLTSPNRLLGGVQPAVALALGQDPSVREAAESFVHGDYV